MLNPRQAFKMGFIARCIEQGHTTPEQISEQVKLASDQLDKAALWGENIVGEMIEAGGRGLSALGNYAVPLAVAAPPVLGAAAGYGMSRLTDVDDSDVDEAKKQEVIAALRQHAARLRQHARPR